MTETAFYHGLLMAWIITAGVTAIALLFITAPYGRHQRSGWGPTIPSRVGWMVMEGVPAVAMGVLFALDWKRATLASSIFLVLFELHYIHRAFIYPLKSGANDKRMPLSVVAMAIVFNTGNGYLNGRYLFHLAEPYEASWLLDARFLAGLVIFAGGMWLNMTADYHLLALRKPGQTGYSIPSGSVFRYVSCPNYLGEILEWCGWALLTWSWAGLSFAIWTAANLAPRAISHHQWYRAHFEDYPPERKALIPFLW